VEGRFDRVFLDECLGTIRPDRSIRVADLEELSVQSTGGVDRLLSYIRENAGVIRARTADSPVVVLLDWDAAARVPTFAKLFSSTDPFRVLAWDAAEANPTLGPSFRGIERFFPDRLIDAAEAEGYPIARTAKGVCSVEKDNYGALKRWLSEKVAAEGLTTDDLTFAEPSLRRLLGACGA
jgi:hypothetical protein